MTNRIPVLMTIEKTSRSQSGKSLGIAFQHEWYQTKCWELEHMVNQQIVANTSVQTFPDGGSITWINDWRQPNAIPAQPGQPHNAQSGVASQTLFNPVAHPQAAAQAAQTQAAPPTGQAGVYQPVAAPQAPISPATGVDRDASIVAQTLCKTVTFSSAMEAWQAYKNLYAVYQAWQGAGCPAGQANPVSPVGGEPSARAESESVPEGPDPYTQAGDPGFGDNIPF